MVGGGGAFVVVVGALCLPQEAIPAVLLPMWTLPLLLDCSEPPLSHLWRGLMGTRGPAHHPFREGVEAGQH